MTSSGTISGLTTPSASVGFYAARRYYDGPAETLALVCSEATLPQQAELRLQTAVLSGSSTFSSAATSTTAIPTGTGTGAVYWSEAFARTQMPVLLLATQSTVATRGVVLPTADVNTQTILEDATADDMKSAVTSCGLVRVLPAGAPTTMQLTVGYVNSAQNNTQPPLADASETLHASSPCDVPLYGANGPFAGTQTSTMPLTAGFGPFPTNPDCYCVAFDGTVTVLYNFSSQGPGIDHWAYRFQAPIPASFTTADSASNAWAVVGLPVAPTTVTTTAHSVTPCNNGARIMAIHETATSALSLFAVPVAFNVSNAIAQVSTMLETEFGAGVRFAFGADKVVWFCNAFASTAKNAIYRVVNVSMNSCSDSALTGFAGELIAYAGASVDGATLYVATSDGADVYIYSFDGSTWVQLFSFTPAGAVIDLVADIIVGDSTVVVAVGVSSVSWFKFAL